MMGYGYNGFGLMSGGWWSIICIIVTVDLVLLGVWLWKQIKKS